MIEALRGICAGLDPADVTIIDKPENSPALDALVPGGQRERELLGKYDGVICIQGDDFDIVCNWLGRNKAILAPHPATITPQVFRNEVQSIGFAASNWLPNVEGLQWFLQAVWPAFTERGIALDIHGSIGGRFANNPSPGVRFHGHTDSLQAIYGHIDILINPVRFGSGLKIKTVEALGNGIPLVTTNEGARGLTDADGHGLLIADDAPSFIKTLDALVNSPALRQRIGAGGLDYARKQLSPETCFGELVARIYAS